MSQEHLAAPPPAPDPPKPSGWPVIGWTLGALSAYLIAQVLALILSGAEAGVDASPGQLLITLIVGGIFAAAVGFVAVPWIAIRRQSVRPPSWRLPQKLDIGWAASILIASYLVIFVYTAAIEAIGADNLLPTSTIESDDFRRTALIAVITGLLVILVAPFAEELFFRRLVLGGLRAAWGAAPALLISAALFAALHADVGSMIPFALIGLLFGFAYIRTNSLTAPTLAHLAFNIIGFSVTMANEGVG